MRAALLLWACSLLAQTPSAAIIDYTPIEKRVAIGTTNCTFWFHAPVAPYDQEIACYQPNLPPLIHANPVGTTTDETLNFPGGWIAWQFKPNAADPTKIDYQISGQATTDAKPVLETGTL